MIRRFTVTDGEETAEGAQFTSGVVVIVRELPDPNPQAFVGIEALHELNPNAVVTWIDEPFDEPE